jgi:Domain of unknown function (DUF4340)
MKLQRTTLILILLALGLGGFVYLYEFNWKNQREEVKEKNQQIFSFAADDVQSLSVKTNSINVNLERNNSSDKPKWLLKSPEQTPASDASVSYLMDLLVKGTTNRILSVSTNQLSEFSLDKPQATIEVKLKNQKTHQLTLGKSDFNRRFLYAKTNLVTKPDGNVDVLLVSPDFENAVNRQLSEWKQPEDNSLKLPSPSPILPSPTNSKKP